jgi:predicted small metal-binding protein
MAKSFTCERDGVVIRGDTDDELVANVEVHIADEHPDLVGKVSREDIVAAAKEA